MKNKNKRNNFRLKQKSFVREMGSPPSDSKREFTKPPVGVKQERTIGFEVREINEDSRTVRVSFSSEQPVNRFWGSEILCHDEGCVDLTRLKEIGVSLFNHDRNVVIGVPQNPTLNSGEKRCYADIYFDDDADSDKIFQKVKKGILRGVSVGYQVDTWEEVASGKTSINGRFKGPCYIATRWSPTEVSIVSVPADDSVGVNREIEQYTKQVQITERNINMDLQALCRSLGVNYEEMIAKGLNDDAIRAMCAAIERSTEADGGKGGGKVDDEEEDEKKKEKAKREATEEAQERSLEILNLCRDFEEDAIPHIQEGRSVEEVRTLILNKVKTERVAIAGSNIRLVGPSEEEKTRAAAVDGLLLRGGITIAKPADGANGFRGMKLRDLAIDCLIREGVSRPHSMSDDELFKRAVTPDSQFASILSAAVNKSMATAYNAAIPTYTQWCGKGSNSDFKAATHYQLSEAGELLPLSQSGELKFDEMKDNGVSKQVVTFGRSFGFTRQAMINDDLGILTKNPQAYVRAALRGRNKLVYKMLGSNPAIYDGTALFHANHKNLAGTAAALSTDALSLARTAMRKQKNQRGKETLNISPQFLIVPAALETKAAQLLLSISDPSQNNPNVKNIFANSMNLVVDAELDEYSSTAFYLAANSADIDTIEVTNLNGNEQPILESQVGFDFVGIKWRILDDFGVTALDYRGLHKNAGA